MRGSYAPDRARLAGLLAGFEKAHSVLPGIADPAMREALIEQFIDSERRNVYFEQLRSRVLDPLSIDPRTTNFDPVRASVLHASNGRIDEAFWMVFLFVHFGRHLRRGWAYSRLVYGRLGAPEGLWWTWDAVSTDPLSFKFWLDSAQQDIRDQSGGGAFGNHRKYESLDAWSAGGTGSVVESYVNWVLSRGATHAEMVDSYRGSSPSETFDAIYNGVGEVIRFGRTGRFDYLMALNRLGLADVSPAHSYLVSATGPLAGAKLLLTGDPKSAGSALSVQKRLQVFTDFTDIPGDVAEDALCNWQKSPSRYVRFSG